MAIQPINPGSVANSAQPTKSAGKSTVDAKSQTLGAVSGDDTISLSHGVQNAAAKDSSPSVVDENRVASIKSALESGNYRIRPDQVASKMLELDNLLHSNTT